MSERWKVTVTSDGEPQPPVAYSGPDESGVCIWTATSDARGPDTPVSFIAESKEEALAGALQCWARSEQGRKTADDA